jgi:hypothetical protein
MGIALALSLAACGSVGVGAGGSGSGTVGPASGPTPPPTDSPPQISGSPATSIIAGHSYVFTPTASDPDGDALTFSIANMPDWASFDAATGLLMGTPPPGAVGSYANISISVSDGQSSVALPPFSIEVEAALAISGTPPTEAAVGSSYNFQPATNAPSGTTLTFSISNMPAWASFSATTGELTGTPTQTGTFASIIISVSDGTQTSALDAFTIIVAAANPTNHPPVISGQPATSVRVGTAYNFTPAASDPDGDKLTFSVANRPAWLSFNNATGTLSGTPSAANVGTYSSIVVSVSDGTTSSALPAFAIQVASALTISGTPPTSVVAGSGYSFQPTTNAKAGTKLTYAVQNLPVWAGFSTSTGLLSGTPSSTQTGIYSNIVISVSDGTQTSALAAFSIKVTASLTISGTPPTQVAAGTAYSFKPTTSAATGTALTFSIQNKPSWASFSTSTGMLSGTPTSGQVGTYSNIVISVSDGSQSSSLPAFSIKVSTSTGPTISGQPASSVNVGAAYSFSPTTTNPSGGTLSFTIQNKPSWMTFNGGTGQLTGTPTAANAGSYANIVISVSDGTSSASLAPFTISVNQASNGSATLDWTPVTQNEDGTPVTGLAGYRVHYGMSASNMSQTVDVANPSVTTYLVSNLSSGTWYFGVAAYTSAGVEGVLSNVGSKAVP